MNCASSVSLEISVFTLLLIWYWLKKFQRVHPKPLLTRFQFSYSRYCRPNFYFNWPTLLSESTHMNCTSSERVTESLIISVFIWNYLQLRTNCFVRSLCVIFNQHGENCIFEEQSSQCYIS